jgi:hypothetical protein
MMTFMLVVDTGRGAIKGFMLERRPLVYDLTVTQELSTKWYNVIRRELRATPVTYEGDPPECPDCGCETHLNQGRYGRFYECENIFACKGTVGARLDGTPRVIRETRTHREARLRARAVVHECLQKACCPPEAETSWTEWGSNYSYSMVSSLLARILKRAEVWRDPGWLLVRAESPQYLHLRRRNLKELARIEAAAKEELRLLRWTPYWDRLIDEESRLEI